MYDLKKKLLSLNILLDNEYLDKYIELICLNKKTKKQKFRTQKHHIIPKCYFKQKGITIDNSTENIVNLLYKDHVLAHFYLCMCSADNDFKYKNFVSIRYVLNNTNYKSLDDHITEKNLIESLDGYQHLYEFGRQYSGKAASIRNKNRKFSEEHCKKISEAKKGYKASSEHIQHNREAQMNTMWINNGLEEKKIYKDLKDKFLIEGWEEGRLKFSKEHSSKISKALSGRKLSEDVCRKMSISRTGHVGNNVGMHWYTDGVNNVMCFEKDCPKGWKKGRVV